MMKDLQCHLSPRIHERERERERERARERESELASRVKYSSACFGAHRSAAVRQETDFLCWKLFYFIQMRTFVPIEISPPNKSRTVVVFFFFFRDFFEEVGAECVV